MKNISSSFIAYRLSTDFVQIYFEGGPLDGQTISTDVRPDSEYLTHHVHGRMYVYRYSTDESGVFHAKMHGYEIPEKAPKTRPGFFVRFFKWFARVE